MEGAENLQLQLAELLVSAQARHGYYHHQNSESHDGCYARALSFLASRCATPASNKLVDILVDHLRSLQQLCVARKLASSDDSLIQRDIGQAIEITARQFM
jgi:hypothetical protein